MSERFLQGFVVDPDKLAALLGTAKLSAKSIRKRTKKGLMSDIDMTLGDGEWREGKPIVDAALAQLAAGKPKQAQAYELVRMVTLVLHAYAKPLGTIEVPYVDSDDFGLWTPVFEALEMPTLAKQYGAASLAFPFKRPAKAVGWPITTLIEGAALAKCNAELATDWAKRLPALPNSVFVDKRNAPNDERIAYTKSDLGSAFVKLKRWIATAVKAKKSLALILDGDQ